ncbi:SRSF protein kinase 2 [Folsomia candida]|uniref:non-specific serine/threonine protein kinase n=1 Tax=Folsomia candida TaxID=158441 RepID=A0A226D0I1_FOLCA|nr:SRSF protein kinase 2 [Folsomia candida]
MGGGESAEARATVMASSSPPPAHCGRLDKYGVALDRGLSPNMEEWFLLLLAHQQDRESVVTPASSSEDLACPVAIKKPEGTGVAPAMPPPPSMGRPRIGRHNESNKTVVAPNPPRQEVMTDYSVYFAGLWFAVGLLIGVLVVVACYKKWQSVRKKREARRRRLSRGGRRRAGFRVRMRNGVGERDAGEEEERDESGGGGKELDDRMARFKRDGGDGGSGGGAEGIAVVERCPCGAELEGGEDKDDKEKGGGGESPGVVDGGNVVAALEEDKIFLLRVSSTTPPPPRRPSFLAETVPSKDEVNEVNTTPTTTIKGRSMLGRKSSLGYADRFPPGSLLRKCVSSTLIPEAACTSPRGGPLLPPRTERTSASESDLLGGRKQADLISVTVPPIRPPSLNLLHSHHVTSSSPNIIAKPQTPENCPNIIINPHIPPAADNCPVHGRTLKNATPSDFSPPLSPIPSPPPPPAQYFLSIPMPPPPPPSAQEEQDMLRSKLVNSFTRVMHMFLPPHSATPSVSPRGQKTRNESLSPRNPSTGSSSIPKKKNSVPTASTATDSTPPKETKFVFDFDFTHHSNPPTFKLMAIQKVDEDEKGDEDNEDKHDNNATTRRTVHKQRSSSSGWLPPREDWGPISQSLPRGEEARLGTLFHRLALLGLEAKSASDVGDPHREKTVQLLDDFKITGVNGIHVCMVFEVLGNNLLKLIIRSNYQGIPLQNVKTIIKQTLQALDYLHTKCKIIHTDIKPENILMCVDDAYVRNLANEATTWQMQGGRLPGSAVSTAPKEFQSCTSTSKMSKNKKKKMKKKAKKQAELLEQQLQQLKEADEDGGGEEEMTGGGDHEESSCSGGGGGGDGAEGGRSHNKSGEEEEKENGERGDDSNNEDVDDDEGRPQMRRDGAVENRSSFNNLANAMITMSPLNGHDDVGGGGGGGVMHQSKSTGESGLDAMAGGMMQNEGGVSSGSGGGSGGGAAGSSSSSSAMRRTTSCPDSKSILARPDPVKEICDIQIKIADLGNACWVDHHFTEDIQTRQYRCLEVLLGAEYGTGADIWSTACMVRTKL